jgi:hypothetical protein
MFNQNDCENNKKLKIKENIKTTNQPEINSMNSHTEIRKEISKLNSRNLSQDVKEFYVQSEKE